MLSGTEAEAELMKMEPAAAIASNIVPSLGLGSRGGFRGRGGAGVGGRGGFERGRGRLMPGRGHFMGAMGRGGVMGMGMGVPPPPQGMMMPGRGGMRLRGPPTYPMRGGGFVLRNGPQIRGARHAAYAQPTKQHSGAENNKTVSPASNAATQAAAGVGAEGANIAAAAVPAGTPQQINKAASSMGEGIANNSQADLVKHNSGSKGTVTNGSLGAHSFSRGGRGRGGHYMRGGGMNGRGAYNHNPNISGYNSFVQQTTNDQSQMNPRRGGGPRGRGGGYAQNMQRPSLLSQQHAANNQSTSLVPLKRGAPTGPGSKRGRYEGAPYAQRSMAPSYHSQQSNVSAPLPPHGGYAIAQPHQAPVPPPPSTSGYSGHDSTHVVDPYSQQYNTSTTHASYNGYGQSSYAAPSQGLSSNTTYVAHSGVEYDQSQYQNYSSYASQPDGRYQNYGQEYSHQYAVTGVDYNQPQQTDYSQHQTAASSATYDERSFTGYDANYQQNYSNPTGYY